MARRRPAAAAALALLGIGALLAGCTNDSDQPSSAASAGQQPSVVSPSSDASTDTSATPATPEPAASGTTTATPTTDLLDWKPLSDSEYPTVTNGSWTLAVVQNGRGWSLGANGKNARTTSAPAGYKVVDVQLSDRYAVAVYGTQQMTRPQQVAVVDLQSRKTSMIDSSSDLPPAAEGAYALDDGTLWRPTQRGREFCLASTDLSSGASTLAWCAPPGNGWNTPVAANGAATILAFDSGQPSCRTILSVAGSRVAPFNGVPACHGAGGADLGPAGTVWALVPDEKSYQRVHLYASAGGATTDLGPGVNGTLTVCGSAAYWARDATSGQPAALMRWDGRALSVAYESKGFLGEPLCAGHVLSIADTTDNGTRQLSTTVS